MRPALFNLTTSLFSTDATVGFKVYDPIPAHCKDCNKTFPVAPRDWFCDGCSSLLWDLAADHPNCAICNVAFSFFFRNHHCRRCGRVCCDRCSPSFALFPVWGEDDKHARRVCTECSSSLMDAQGVPVTNNDNNNNNTTNSNNANNGNSIASTRRIEPRRNFNNNNQQPASASSSPTTQNQNGSSAGGHRQASFNLHFILMEALKNYSIDSMPKELLQNSDDANCKSVTFVLDHQRRTLWHFQDGELSDKDFDALGNFYGHTKMTDFTKIGRFGVGFVSCFHLTDKPIVQSRGRYWAMQLETLQVEDTAVDDPNDNKSDDDEQEENDDDNEEDDQAKIKNNNDDKEKQSETDQSKKDDADSRKENDKQVDETKKSATKKIKKKPKKEPRQKFYGLQLPETLEKAIPNVERGAVFCYSFRDIPLELSHVITFPVSSMERCEQVFTSILNHHSILFFLNSVRSLRLYSLRRDGTAKELINNSILPNDDLNRIKSQARTSLQQLRNLPYVETRTIQLRTKREDANSSRKQQQTSSTTTLISSSSSTAIARSTSTTATTTNQPTETQNGDENNNMTQSLWYYSCEIVIPEKINAATATAEQKLANAPVTVQLAAPLGDREAPSPIFAVGLPLTGIKNPLLANASATLDLDATRINIRNLQTSRRNHLAVVVLVRNYCHRFLPLLDSYINDNWPVVVDDITDAFMNVLFKSIINETMRISRPAIANTSSFSSDTFAAPLFGILFGGRDHLAYFSSLCFLADKDKGDLVYGVYQRIAMATYPEFKTTSAIAAATATGATETKNLTSSVSSSSSSTLRLPLISILNDKYQQQYKTVNQNNLTVCTPDYLLRQLQQVDVATLDRAGISTDERLLLLRFFLQSSSASVKNAQSLKGLPFRQTTRGWSRFDPNVLTFFGDEKAQVTKILLPSPKSDAIASEAMSRIFRVISVPDVVTELDMSHLLANNSRLLMQQIEHVIEHCKTDASANVVAYLSEFWKFISASLTKHRQTTIGGNLHQYLSELPIIPSSAENGDGKNLWKVSALSSMICATPPSITTTSGVTPDLIKILTQVFKIPLVHQDLMPAVFTHPQAAASKLENFKHIIGLIKYKLVDVVASAAAAAAPTSGTFFRPSAASLYKFTDRDFATIRQYILDNRIGLDQAAREIGPQIKMLPIFRLLGGGGGGGGGGDGNTSLNDGSQSQSEHTNLLHRNARFIPEDLFVQLPSFAKEAALIAVSPVIARALQLPLDRLDDVIRNALTGDRWLSLDPKEQLSIFQWIVQQNKIEMLTDVRVPTLQQSKSAKICDLYYFKSSSSSTTNATSGLDDLLLQVSRKYCPEHFADPDSALKEIVEEAIKSKNIKTALDAPLVKEMMRRVISNFRPFNVELKLGQSHMKVWESFPPQYQDIVIVLKELFYFPHHLQSLDQAGIPFCVAVKKIEPPQQQQQQQQQQQRALPPQEQQQQQQNIWGFFGVGQQKPQQAPLSNSTIPQQQNIIIDKQKETFQVIITRSENAISEQYFEIIGGLDTPVALPPPPPHDKHDGVRYGKKPLHDAFIALAQRWRELLSLMTIWPNCADDCKCRRPQFLNALPTEKGRHVVFLCYIIESELLRLIRQNLANPATVRTIGEALRKILPRSFPFLMVPGRPAAMLFEAPEDCCSAETFDPLIPVVKEKLWREIYGIPQEPQLSPQFCKKVLEKWLGEHLPSKGVLALTRILMHLLRTIPPVAVQQQQLAAATSSNRNSSSRHHHHGQHPSSSSIAINPLLDLATWMILPNRQSTMCLASSLVYIYGSEDSEIMKLLSLDEDISSRLVHPQFSHRRLGSRLDQLGVRNFRDALQLPIQDFKEDASMLKRQQVYQSRITSDAFAKVLELLLIDAENGLELLEDGFENPFGGNNNNINGAGNGTTATNHQDPNANFLQQQQQHQDPETVKQQRIDEIKRTVARLKKVQILLVNRLRVSWGNNKQQQQQQSNQTGNTTSPTIKTLDSLPYAIEKIYAIIHARNTSSVAAVAPTRAITGARFFLLTWRMDNLTEAPLNCDEEELRSSLVDCILEYLSIDDKLGKKLTYWLKRDENELTLYLNRRKQEEEKQVKGGDENVVPQQLTAQELLANAKTAESNKEDLSKLNEEEKRKREQEKLKLQFAEQERMRLKKEEDERKQKEIDLINQQTNVLNKDNNNNNNNNMIKSDQIEAPKILQGVRDPLSAAPSRPDIKSNANAPRNNDDDDDGITSHSSSVEDIPTGTVVPNDNDGNKSSSQQQKQLQPPPPASLPPQTGFGGFLSKFSNFLSLGNDSNKNPQPPQQPPQQPNSAAATSLPPVSPPPGATTINQQQQQQQQSSLPQGIHEHDHHHNHHHHHHHEHPPSSQSQSSGLIPNGTKFSTQNPDQKFTLDDPFTRPRNDFNYNDNAATSSASKDFLPPSIPGTRSESSPNELPQKQITDTPCAIVDDIVPWAKEGFSNPPKPGCCKIYITRGATLPETYRGTNVMRAIESFSIVLKEISVLVDPDSFKHCALYWSVAPSNTLAFNSNGSMFFNLSFYCRDPDPYEWMGTFLHEYAHNSVHDHGLMFVKALQSLSGRVIKRLMGKDTPDP